MDRTVTLNLRWVLVAGLVAAALVAAYLVGRAGPAPAQAEAEGAARTVTVTGTGHVSVVPDQLGFELSVSVLRADLEQAMNDASTSMQAVVDTLRTAGVAEEDVQTTDVSMYPQYDRVKGKSSTLRGYRVSQTVSVTVEDLAGAGDIVTAALGAGGAGVRLGGLHLQVGDPEAALAPARSDAVDQARAKAEEYAADAGLELGDLVRVSEVGDRPFVADLAYSAADSAGGSSAALPIQPGQQDLTATVVVVYDLR